MTSEPGARLVVDLSGTIVCDPSPDSCIATLSVLPSGTEVSNDWRPADTDPYWGPDWSSGASEAQLHGSLPTIARGEHELVVSLVHNSDVPSYLPDGSVAIDLVVRCQHDVSIQPGTRVAVSRITFVGWGLSTASCSIQVQLDPA